MEDGGRECPLEGNNGTDNYQGKRLDGGSDRKLV